MAGISKIQYKGKEIIYIDFTKLNEAQMIDLAKESESNFLKEEKESVLFFLKKTKKKKPKLFLVNITGTFVSPEFMHVAIRVGEKVKHLSQKSAIVGVTEADSVYLKGFNAIINGEMKAFNAMEEAQEFLVR